MNELRQRTLGESGIEVPVVGLGCNNFGSRLDAEATGRVVHAALDAGITFFDTADIYGGGESETQLGRALVGRRHRAVIATKFGGNMGKGRGGGSAAYVSAAVEDSLRRLGTDHIDLYQHHFFDEQTPLEETLEALDRLVQAGKVRATGSSNYSGAQIDDAERISAERGWARYVTAQNHYNLLQRDEVEATVMPVCERLDLGILPYFPLASGLLTGKYRRDQAPPPGTRLSGNPARAAELASATNFDIVEGLEQFARHQGITVLDVAIGALAAQDQVVSVIAGATSAEQVAANAGAGRWIPSADDLAEIDRITRRQPAVDELDRLTALGGC